MYRQVNMTAYDVMDQVHITVIVTERRDGTTHSSEWITVAVTDIASVGEADRLEWIRDALVGALEAL